MHRRLYPDEEYPNGHCDIADDLLAMGYQFCSEEKYERAQECFEQAMAVLQRLYPAGEHPQGHRLLAVATMGLGSALQSQGDFAGAEKLSRHAVEMYRLLYPLGHHELVVSHNELGMLLTNKGEHDKAIRHLEQAVEMCESLYPKTQFPCGHPTWVRVLNNLSVALMRRGDADRASGCAQLAFRMQQQQIVNFIVVSSEAESLKFIATRDQIRLLSTSRHTKQPADEVYPHLWLRRRLTQRLIAGRQVVFQQSRLPQPPRLYQEYLSTRQALAHLILKQANGDG